MQRRVLSNLIKIYGIPAIYNVWQKEQSARTNEVEGKKIVIASDMRVDSPGHSGLFGSGSTLDMKRNIILDTQVIKVNKYTQCTQCLHSVSANLAGSFVELLAYHISKISTVYGSKKFECHGTGVLEKAA